MNLVLEPAREGWINVVFEVGSQDGDSAKIFNALEQVGYFLVGKAVIGTSGFGPCSEQGIGLIKKENPVLVFCLIKNFGEVLLGFAYPFGYDEREVDFVDIATGKLAEQTGGECFSGSRWAVKEAFSRV